MNPSSSLKFLLSSLLLASAVTAAPPTPRPANGIYKICVPETALEACKQMVSDVSQTDIHIGCVSGRDRLDCLEKIKSHEADFGPIDPEDLYIASNIPGEDFNVFKEIRTKEEPAEEFRYEAIAVVHKELKISKIEELKALKSCHTGVGRNVGYKIPITKLAKMGVLGPMNDSSLTSRENELKALSQFFSKACLAGKWASDPEYNRKLKSTYSNLCELCENPTVCDYPDKYSGYDGALRCLSENGGDVAWTKVYYVKKHFGIGGQPATEVSADDYRYLCPDGTKVPVSTTPKCRFAARPWQGYLTTGDLAGDVAAMRTIISRVNTIGEETHSDWLKKVLELDNNYTDKCLVNYTDKTVAVDNDQPQSARGYLDKANYTDVIARNWGSKEDIRFCVITDTELSKCQDFAKSAFSRDIRPAFGCVQQATLQACLKTIRDGGAEIISLDGCEVSNAQTDFNLKPIVSEQYGDHTGEYYAVAVVKKGTSYQSIGDLKGARSCHTAFGRTAGWNIPLYALLSKNLISKTTCPHAKAVSEFFSGGSCVPGALLPENNPNDANPASLCSNCAGNSGPKGTEAKCAGSHEEDFFCSCGAFRCLASGAGDVAFLDHTIVPDNTDGKNNETWAADLKSADYELLCLDGGRAPVDQYKTCNLAQVPPYSLVASSLKTDHDVDAIREAVITAGELYSRRPELFRLFGEYKGKSNVLFSDSATGLVSAQEVITIQEKYNDILKVIKTCG